MNLRITTLAVLGLALAAALTALIIWAFFAADFWSSFGAITADPWGIVSLADLYIGFVVTSVVMFAVERGRPFVWLIIIPVFFLGNVVTALWLAWRAGLLLRLASRQAA
jgi:hypothetical protein